LGISSPNGVYPIEMMTFLRDDLPGSLLALGAEYPFPAALLPAVVLILGGLLVQRVYPLEVHDTPWLIYLTLAWFLMVLGASFTWFLIPPYDFPFTLHGALVGTGGLLLLSPLYLNTPTRPGFTGQTLVAWLVVLVGNVLMALIYSPIWVIILAPFFAVYLVWVMTAISGRWRKPVRNLLQLAAFTVVLSQQGFFMSAAARLLYGESPYLPVWLAIPLGIAIL
jgi:hypothetical protein